MSSYFTDSDRVMDIESRAAHCVVSLQGPDQKNVTKQPYCNDEGTPNHHSPMGVSLRNSKNDNAAGLEDIEPQRH